MIIELLMLTLLGASVPDASGVRAPREVARKPSAETRLVGLYRGEVRDGGADVLLVTSIASDGRGGVWGTYVVGRGEDIYTGRLEDFEVVGDRADTFRFVWRDRHGWGTLVVSMSPDGRELVGHWGPEDEMPTHPWSGTRVRGRDR